jgi:hypothetical protein
LKKKLSKLKEKRNRKTKGDEDEVKEEDSIISEDEVKEVAEVKEEDSIISEDEVVKVDSIISEDRCSNKIKEDHCPTKTTDLCSDDNYTVCSDLSTENNKDNVFILRVPKCKKVTTPIQTNSQTCIRIQRNKNI